MFIKGSNKSPLEVWDLINIDFPRKEVSNITQDNINNLTETLLFRYSKNYGLLKCKNEIMSASPSNTHNFLTHLIEVGVLRILYDLKIDFKNITLNQIIFISQSINLSLTNFINNNIIEPAAYKIYFDFEAIDILIPRILNHIDGINNEGIIYFKNLYTEHLHLKSLFPNIKS